MVDGLEFDKTKELIYKCIDIYNNAENELNMFLSQSNC